MNKQAIILSGGLGTRLRSEIGEYPKPMAEVAGKPFLEFILMQLKAFDFNKVVLAVGYKYEIIQDYFGNDFQGMELVYSVEEERLGTGGAIRLALENCDTESVLVCNGDSLFNIDLNKFLAQSKQTSFECNLALNKMQNIDRYGLVNIDTQNKIIGFEEKAFRKEALINSGIYYLNKEAFVKKTPSGNFSMENEYFELEFKNGILGGHTFEAFFRDIGIPEDFNKAQYEFEAITFG